MTTKLLPSFKRRKSRTRLPRSPRPSVDSRRLTLAICTVGILSVLMSIHFLPDKVSLRVGDRSPTEIRAPRSVVYTDTEATARLRQAAANRAPSTYDPDPTALAQATHVVSDVFEKARRVRMDSSLPMMAQKVARLGAELGDGFAPEQRRYLLSLPLATSNRLQTAARRLVEDVMSREIRSDTSDLEHAKAEFNAAARMMGTPADAAVLRAIGNEALRPNQLYDARKTARQRDIAASSVAPVRGEVHLGEIVVRRDEIFTQQDLDKCKALGLINPRIDLDTGAAICVLAAVMVMLVAVYIRRTFPAIYADTKRLFLLSLIVIVSVVGLRVFGALLGIPLSGVQFGYLGMMTVVAAGMLIAVLLNPQIAMLVTALLAVQSGLIMNHEIRFSIMTLISSLVGIYSVSNIRDRTHLQRATFALALTNLALVWVLGGLLGDTLKEVLAGSVWAVASAAFAIAIFWFGVAMLEKPFGILTHFWLLELSSSDRPLLRELCMKAPGTYAHSIMVGNLAEAGAEAVGADTLFCRVASYYHDVGKMKRPHCFVENQRAENIHNTLNPSLSALVIASHVRDGLALAQQHRLPKEIQDVIQEHHGTSLIRYFYHLAIAGCNESHRDPVLEQHFRYDGPCPQTRESGIIMLADSIEAAARCLDKPTPHRVQDLVASVVQDKLMDGQLDDCELTFKDIRKIQDAFVRVLSAMLHGRIDYPELPKAHAGLHPEFADAPREDEAVIASRSEGSAL